MPVRRVFQALVTPSQILGVASSLGAHIASKLQSLGSDERTLTDELCDMFLIWSQEPVPRQSGEFPLQVTFYKSTQTEEKAVGFDLLVRVIAPDGRFKEALFQSKVFDPDILQFRHDSRAGWSKLRQQLLRMRAHASDGLYFLLVYVPASILNSARYDFTTWEQGFCRDMKDYANESRFGATGIAGSDLLNEKGGWQLKQKCEHVSDGNFRPTGHSFARLIVDMMLCNLGNWRAGPLSPEDKRQLEEPSAGGPRVELTIGFDPSSLRDGWPQFLDSLRLLTKSDLK